MRRMPRWLETCKRRRERSKWPFTGFANAIANFFARKSRTPSPILPRWSLSSGFWRLCLLGASAPKTPVGA